MMMYARGALSVQSHAHRVVIYASTGNRSREVVWGATNPNPEYMRERERERENSERSCLFLQSVPANLHASRLHIKQQREREREREQGSLSLSPSLSLSRFYVSVDFGRERGRERDRLWIFN